MPHPNPTEKDYRHVDQARLHRNALRLRSDDVHRQPLIQRLSSEAKGCHGSPSSFPESGCAGVPAEPGIPALRGFVTGLSTLRNRSGVRGVNDPGCVVQVGSAFGRVVSADPRPASLLQVLQLLIHLPVILRPPRAAVFFAGAAIVAGVSSRSGCIPRADCCGGRGCVPPVRLMKIMRPHSAFRAVAARGDPENPFHTAHHG